MLKRYFKIKGVETPVWLTMIENQEYAQVDTKNSSVCTLRFKYDPSALLIKTDTKGNKFFIYNEERIYLDSWIRSSMKQVKERIKNNKLVTVDDLYNAIMSDGIDNVRFVIQMPLCKGFGYKKVRCKLYQHVHSTELNESNVIFMYIPDEDDHTVLKQAKPFFTSDLLNRIVRGEIEILDSVLEFPSSDRKFFIISNHFWRGREEIVGYVLDTEENVKKAVEEINEKRGSRYYNTTKRLHDIDIILYHEVEISSLEKIRNDRRCIRTREVF